MVGKKNIVFGFLYLVLTAALGPYMVLQHKEVEQVEAKKKQAFAELQQLAANDFEKDLEPLSAEQIARINSRTLLALNDYANAEAPLDFIKSGPHVHGNLESVLNIAAGLTLLLVSGAVWFKQIISWLFILGALLHSGSLYLIAVFHVGWAEAVLNSALGPIFILLGLALMGILALFGSFERRR